MGRKAKQLMDSPEYKEVFQTRLKEDSQAAGKWETQQGGEYQVDYSGGGELAFLEGGDAAAVKITMTMQEMQIWTREDYTGQYTDPGIRTTTGDPTLVGF